MRGALETSLYNERLNISTEYLDSNFLNNIALTNLFVPVFIHPTEGIYDIDIEEDYERVKSMLLRI